MTSQKAAQPSHTLAYVRRYGGMVACVAIFLGTYIYAVRTTHGQVVDSVAMTAMTTWIDYFHNMDRLMLNAVSVPVMVGVIALSAIIAFARRRAALAVRAAIMIVASAITSYALKFYILPRPQLGITHGAPASYPSGHATVAACAAFAFILVVPHAARIWASLFGAIIITLMGIVVVSHSWHRPSDVIGAITVVAFWALLVQPIERSKAKVGRIRPVLYAATALISCAAAATFAMTVSAMRTFPYYEALNTQAVPGVAGVAGGLSIAAFSLFFALYVERQVHP